jgi:DNA (cytosine-5)-methyltransferase 1
LKRGSKLDNNSFLIPISQADIKNNKIRLKICGKEFFPPDVFGGRTREEAGNPILLNVSGINKDIRTDIPTDANGRPRWFTRNRKWLGEFYNYYNARPGNKVKITRSSLRNYLVEYASNFTFIDLFAGIGGIRLAFEKAGGRCVFSSEWDKFACQTYFANHGDMPHGDITKIRASDIPDHDILAAGFPCQPFSIAGVSKKNALGKKHGFLDETQGTLFFDICRIIKEKQPKAFLLENVRNLKSHDKGKTYKIIKKSLEELGYNVSDKIIDGQLVVPQHRERIYIVGIRNGLNFEFPNDHEIKSFQIASKLGDILEPNVHEKYTLTAHLWNYLQAYKAKHQKAGNGFGYGLNTHSDISRTLSARYYKDGSEVLIKQGNKNPRRLTPRECARLMGFDKPGESRFQIPVSDTQAYKQFGNSVVVPVVTAVAQKLVQTLSKDN